MIPKYEYKFVRLGEAMLAVRKEAKRTYQEVIDRHARVGGYGVDLTFRFSRKCNPVSKLRTRALDAWRQGDPPHGDQRVPRRPFSKP
jgi:hypothetical protein